MEKIIKKISGDLGMGQPPHNFQNSPYSDLNAPPFKTRPCFNIKCHISEPGRFSF